jgi:hypothetical protein
MSQFLQGQLANLDLQSTRLEYKMRTLTTLHHKSRPRLNSHQLALLPEAARRTLQRYEEDSILEIERYLHEYFLQVRRFVALD